MIEIHIHCVCPWKAVREKKIFLSWIEIESTHTQYALFVQQKDIYSRFIRTQQWTAAYNLFDVMRFFVCVCVFVCSWKFVCVCVCVRVCIPRHPNVCMHVHFSSDAIVWVTVYSALTYKYSYVSLRNVFSKPAWLLWEEWLERHYPSMKDSSSNWQSYEWQR